MEPELWLENVQTVGNTSISEGKRRIRVDVQRFDQRSRGSVLLFGLKVIFILSKCVK